MCYCTGTAVELNNKIEEQRAYATIGRVYLTKAQSQSNALQKTDDLAKSIKCAEKYFLKSLLICKGGYAHRFHFSFPSNSLLIAFILLV